MPDVPGPEGLQPLSEVAKDLPECVPIKTRRLLTQKRPFEFRPVHPLDLDKREKRAPINHFWIRAAGALPDDPMLHQNLLAYVSDYELLGASTLPHGLSFIRDNVMMASLDHALWFHRCVKIDDWHLYAIDSPNASGARGMSRGQFFSQDGALVASTAQEGLVRVVEASKKAPRSHPRHQA